MTSGIDFKQSRNASENGIGEGPHEIERLRAMSDFEKNVKPGEYIDCDLYGREDSRILSGMTSTGEGGSAPQVQSVKGPRRRSSGQTRFVATGMFGKKLRSMFGKMSRTIDCFCWSPSTSRATDGDEAESTRPVSAACQPTVIQEHEEFSNDKSLVGADALEEKLRPAPEDRHVERGVEIVEELEEDGAPGRVDDTPRRVKSKVDSGDDMSVVEKGMVVKTLTRLRSTGSFVFKGTRSLASQDEISKDRELHGELHVEEDSCLGSRDSANVSKDAPSAPSRGAVTPLESGMVPVEVSSPESNNSAPLLEDDTTVEATVCITPDNSVLAGGVRKLRSRFEYDTSSVMGAVAGQKFEAQQEAKSSIQSLHHDETRVPSGVDLETVEADVEVPNRSFDVDRDSQDACTATSPLSEVKTVEGALQVDGANVPDHVIIRKVSSSLQVTALALEQMPLNHEGKDVSALEECETAPKVKGVEQAPLLSAQAFSRHVSGHVQKMKSLFESRSSDEMAGNDHEEESESETDRICAGLSDDSGLLCGEDGSDEEAIEREEQSQLTDAMDGSKGAKTCGAVKATVPTKEAAEAAVVDERVGDIAIIPEVGDFVDGTEDLEHNDGDGTGDILELEVWGVSETTEHANERHMSSGESSHVDSVEESSSSSRASSDNLSQPDSHFVGSCMVM
ncbi:hypothetical protein FGB62_61g186 [Gracilaria domingensis]|nr:hypothetical protein FGB62_61g186 [Gracilaria domingensis]